MQIKRDLICERGGKVLPQTACAAIHGKVRGAARSAAANGQTRATVMSLCRTICAIPADPDWQLKRVWSYMIELPVSQPAAGVLPVREALPCRRSAGNYYKYLFN